METILYLLLAVFVAVGFLAIWFFYFYTSVPVLNADASLSKAERGEKIDRYLTGLQTDGKFNGAVLLARSGTPVLINTYGFADHALNNELDNRSSFRLASVSKQFTAAGVLRAQELGLLDIDRPIADYLPGLPYADVTVRHLLNHLSGIPDAYLGLAKTHRAEIGDILSITKAVDLLRRYGAPLRASPGEKFEYSNTGYVLLAGIIEATSGLTFENFMQSELFDPLNMTRTRVFNLDSDTGTFPGRVEDYVLILGKGRPLEMDFIDGVAGDGAVFASIGDLLIWDAFWNGENGLVSDELLRQAFDVPVLNDGTESDYGFGWVLKKSGTHWHNGSWLGARTLIKRYPVTGEVVVLLDNTCNAFRFDKIATNILRAWEQNIPTDIRA